MSAYTFNGIEIPERIMKELVLWIDSAEHPSSFLWAVLRNDLRATLAFADKEAFSALPAILGYLYNEAPHGCYGSFEAINSWVAKKNTERLMQTDWSAA